MSKVKKPKGQLQFERFISFYGINIKLNTDPLAREYLHPNTNFLFMVWKASRMRKKELEGLLISYEKQSEV